MYLAQRELFVELSDKSKRGKYVVYFLLEISKVRPEVTCALWHLEKNGKVIQLF